MQKKDIELMLFDSYQKKRAEHFEEFLQNEKYIYQFEDIKQKDKQIRNITVDIAHKKYAKEDSTSLEEKLKEYKEEYVSLFKKHNLDLSLTTPHYDCEYCSDLGYVDGEKCPNCYTKNYIKKLIEICGTNLKDFPYLTKLNFAEYGDKTQQMQYIVNKLIEVCKGSKINTITLMGKTGTGKTFLAKSFMKSYIIKQKISKYLTAFNLAQLLLPNPDNDFGATPIKELVDYDLLVIDDLGAESCFKNTPASLLTLINERQEQNKLTIITTNLSLLQLRDRYTERLFSRLMDKNISLIFNFDGKDLRVNKNSKD